MRCFDERMADALSADSNGLRTRRNPQLIASFLAEGMDILLDAENLLKRWRQHPRRASGAQRTAR
jgi:chemosensory pili system protein ChpA (sensor histidine kinase/response regulator)